MNESLTLLACDHPKRRIVEWLEQCSAYLENKEDSIVGSKADADDVPHSISNIQGENDLGEQRQNKNISTASKNICSRTRHRRSSESDSGCLTSSTAWRIYSLEENQQIIKYIINRDAFPFIKGTLLWQKMEKERVCYRSWQSMRSQFITKIYPHLGTYSLEGIDKEKFIECMKPSKQTKFIHMEPGQRGWRKNGKYYTVEEDIVILKYISLKHRHLKVHGNSMWQTMEDRHILSGRSWQSMRSRYLNVIRHSLDKYELKKHGVEILVHSKKNGLSGKEKQSSVCEESQPFKTTSTIARNKKNELRKYAISASIQLACNLNLYGKTSQSVKCANNEAQHMVTTLPHNEIPDPKAQEFVDNNTSEKNSRIDDASENDIEDAITCTSAGPNFQNSAVETPTLSLSQHCDGTYPFVENNSSKENSENVDINVECDTSFKLPSVPNLQECTLAASAVPIHTRCDGVKTIADLENHKFTSQRVKCVNDEAQHIVTTLPHNEILDPKAQEFVDDNTSEKNSRIDDASENDIEDEITCTSTGSNFQNSAVETPALSLSQCCDGTHPFVENNSSKENSENVDINVECDTSFELPCVPNLQECTLAAPAVPIHTRCDGVKTIADLESHTFTSGSRVENNGNSSRNLEHEDSMLEPSIFSTETVIFDQEECLRSSFMIKNCKECSSDHMLSPSSN